MFAAVTKRAVLALRQRHDDPDRAANAAGDAAARVLPNARRVAEVSKLLELGHRAVHHLLLAARHRRHLLQRRHQRAPLLLAR